MDIRKKLGNNLRHLVAQKQISLERFAYENQVSKGYIYDIARGKANVSITMLEKLAKGLRVKPQDLIS